jgi:hypothetical protein
MAYLDNNKRELELTRHISLRQLDPLALLRLRTQGTCKFSVPEWLYDLDCPGHYMRRIKSVALSIPSVTGPYTSVNCTVSLLRSTIRTSGIADSSNYLPQPGDDSRFVSYAGALQSVVTSGGTMDSGLFEANLRDERFLPFEGAGAISTWQLTLPSDYRSFDYMTISDVILHVRYTARQGIPADIVAGALGTLFASTAGSNLALLFMLRNDFPTEWAAFVSPTATTPTFAFRLRKDHFPYFVQGMALTVNALLLYGDGLTPAAPQPAIPANAGDLNDSTKGYVDISLQADSAALLTSAAQVYLIIQYSATLKP